MNFYIETIDKRNTYLKKMLADEGKTVHEFSLENAEKLASGDICIFSPAKKFTAEEVKAFAEGITVYSGNITDETANIFKEKNIQHINFLSDEIFAYKNAWLTAEGTLAEILIHGQRSLFENKYLLLGFGRCTRALALLLSKLGIKYDIATFNPLHVEQSSIFAEKTYFKHEFLNNLHEYDFVINSMPIKVFEDDMLKKFKKGAVVLEIASFKCLNPEKAEHFSYVPAPALPQKYTSESAARIMLKKITGEKI